MLVVVLFVLVIVLWCTIVVDNAGVCILGMYFLCYRCCCLAGSEALSCISCLVLFPRVLHKQQHIF